MGCKLPPDIKLIDIKNSCKNSKACEGCCFYLGKKKGCFFHNSSLLPYEWELREFSTYLEDFIRKNPNAPLNPDGTPIPCRRYIYGGEQCRRTDCSACWREIKVRD